MNPSPERLITPVMELRQRALALEQQYQDAVNQAASGYRESARNLLHYLALRQVDVRDLQDELAALGLSSLGRSEAHTLHTLDAVLIALHRLAGREPQLEPVAAVDFKLGRTLLQEHTRRLFGPGSGKRAVRIMVTMPTEAASNSDLVRHLLASGMDVMRINCAHDDAETWLKMIENLRRAERELGRTCKVYADLAGPKLRTGPLATSARVIKLRPERDLRGCVLKPARVWFTPEKETAASLGDAPIVPLSGDLLSQARRGDVIALTDTRGKSRELKVVAKSGESLLAECDKTFYLETGLGVRLLRKKGFVAEGRIGELPAVAEPILLRPGDKLIVTNDDAPGSPAVLNPRGEVVRPAQISCTLGESFAAIKPGENIWFDDGKICGRVLENDGARMLVEIIHTNPAAGAKLGAEKGINLPGTKLDIPSLTQKDLDDLAVMASRVDMIGLSFVRNPEDVWALREEINRLKVRDVGVILKIETRAAFENLPQLLLASMQLPPVGVMVARGDLAVEVGFERLAEVQEEILWLCEAAHVPVIWATQVLESMAKFGSPSRAEVSDAVMSGRAECVMLNKGPYIVEAVRFLNGVLERMEAHQSKKRARLRRLSISRL
ncbi:MAG: pyruvate kinase [Candidatus Brachytrichaceae bacterium NZ_4S206]|jgi:pyruvate kinase